MRHETERQLAWVAQTCTSLRCIYIYIYIYIYLSVCTAYISSHYKGPEQDQLRSSFVPYVRNTAERSIHNFDSQPYIYNQSNGTCFLLPNDGSLGFSLSTLDRRSPVVFPLRQTGASEKKSGAISSKVGTIADCMCNICMLFYMQCNIIYIYISVVLQ